MHPTMFDTHHGSLFQALYDYQPSVNDDEPSQAWISTMEKAYINLGRCVLEYKILLLI